MGPQGPQGPPEAGELISDIFGKSRFRTPHRVRACPRPAKARRSLPRPAGAWPRPAGACRSLESGRTPSVRGFWRPPEDSRDCRRQPLADVEYGKSNLGPYFGHFRGFLDDFWVISGSKMTDFELGPECRPELFEVYLGVLPGSFLGPPWILPGPPWGGPWAPLGPLGPPGPPGVVWRGLN